MLSFHSASARVTHSRRAIAECMDVAFDASPPTDCALLVIHASMGHDFEALLDESRRLAPGARVVGASCCGIVGSEGASESMKDVAIMAVRGDPAEIAVAHVEDVRGENSYARCRELGQRLKAQNPAIDTVYFLASGIDIASDRCIAGLEAELGTGVTIFGATASDNMKGATSLQFVGRAVHEHAAVAVGFADPTLETLTRATHGFVAHGEPLVVTRASGHRIVELNGRPAWREYTHRLGLDADATCAETIPIGALAEELPPHLHAEYGSPHILRVVTRRDAAGVMYYATECREGTRLWLTTRDENMIFSEAQRMMDWFGRASGGRKPVAVFHADCLARGRHLFNRVLKEELVQYLQRPLASDGRIPPWLGMYGFGEFARLGGANTFHNYTSAICAVYRR